MQRFSLASLLLLAGGVLLLIGLPLQWSSVSTTDGTFSISLKGLDYAGYDVIVTIVLAIILIVSALGVYGARRWGRTLGVIGAVLACLWAALVYVAAGNPTVDGTTLPGVKISVGFGAIMIAIGAVVALIGAILSFTGRRTVVATTV